jgi:undecaprenyl pyrophosphate synthase
MLKISIFEVESDTKNYFRYFVHITIVYGCHNEIVATAKKIVATALSCSIPVNCITSDLMTESMYP